MSTFQSEDHGQKEAAFIPPARTTDTATITKSLRVKGEVTVSESLFVEGKVEGSISAPNCRVTIAQNAEVFADITAREVIVIGKVLGNVIATEHVDIRSDGWVDGLVSTKRIRIGDGAHFHGGVSILT